jgi:N-acetylmuramoyl-L-alanine amidase
VIIRSRIVGFLLLTLAAGCATRSHRNTTNAPDWEAESTVSIVRPEPIIAAPPEPEPATPPGKRSPIQPTETWVPLNRWLTSQGLAAPTLLAKSPLPSYTVDTPVGPLILKAGSKLAQCGGLELRLGFSPQLIDGQPFVHRLDLLKTIVPLMGLPPAGLGPGAAGSSPRSGALPVIVLDPGHGGEDSGTKSVGANRYEKEFTLDWARRLGLLLTTAGWQVFFTRTNDTEVSLSNRVLFAQSCKAELFVSLHFNSAASDGNEAGLETYCLTPSGMPSTVTRGFGDEPGSVFPNNAFDAQNLQLAYCVHRELLQVNGHRDRGVRRARFLSVLRGQQRPAILVEGGYLSNRREAHLIADPAYRQRLAEAVARALPASPHPPSPVNRNDATAAATQAIPQPSLPGNTNSIP